MRLLSFLNPLTLPVLQFLKSEIVEGKGHFAVFSLKFLNRLVGFDVKASFASHLVSRLIR